MIARVIFVRHLFSEPAESQGMSRAKKKLYRAGPTYLIPTDSSPGWICTSLFFNLHSLIFRQSQPSQESGKSRVAVQALKLGIGFQHGKRLPFPLFERLVQPSEGQVLIARQGIIAC